MRRWSSAPTCRNAGATCSSAQLAYEAFTRRRSQRTTLLTRSRPTGRPANSNAVLRSVACSTRCRSVVAQHRLTSSSQVCCDTATCLHIRPTQGLLQAAQRQAADQAAAQRALQPLQQPGVLTAELVPASHLCPAAQTASGRQGQAPSTAQADRQLSGQQRALVTELRLKEQPPHEASAASPEARPGRPQPQGPQTMKPTAAAWQAEPHCGLDTHPVGAQAGTYSAAGPPSADQLQDVHMHTTWQPCLSNAPAAEAAGAINGSVRAQPQRPAGREECARADVSAVASLKLRLPRYDRTMLLRPGVSGVS